MSRDPTAEGFNGLPDLRARLWDAEDAIAARLAREVLSASGGQTLFALARVPAEPGAVRLFINGQRFAPPEFTVSGAALTWGSSFVLTASDTIEAEYF